MRDAPLSLARGAGFLLHEAEPLLRFLRDRQSLADPSEELEHAPGPETLSGQLPRRAVMRVIAGIGELVGWRLPLVHGMALVYAVSHGYALLEQPTPEAASEP